MKFKTIFISGVHGVGKGTICKNISKQFFYPHHSASELIKSIKNAGIDKNKIVIDADKNQNLLITALNQLNIDSKFLLLDGHFCLQGNNGVIKLPLETFQKVNLAAIILLIDDPASIHSRLLSRDNSSLGIDTIHSLQVKEIEHANYISKNLAIPLFESNIIDNRKITSWLSTIIPPPRGAHIKF